MTRRPSYDVRLARDARDVLASQRLRYDVFVRELGADGPGVDHTARTEADTFDAVFDHLLLVDTKADPEAGAHVVGAYRLLPYDRMPILGRYYCDDEFDLGPLLASGRKLVELGRSCVHPDHRRGAAMLLLWNGLAQYVIERGIEVMFGAASFHGADADRHAMALSWLHRHHLAPEAMRVRVRPENGAAMNRIAPDTLDEAAALAAIPPLIKSYLRLGGVVGDGAYLDRTFNTTDVCLIMDTATMSGKAVDFYTRKTPRA